MTEAAQRLRRLFPDELGECCDGDVEQRREELRGLGLPKQPEMPT